MLHASSVLQAWTFLKEESFFSLIVMEIKLSDGNGRAFLAALRKHPYLKNHPVLVYSRAQDRETIRKTVEMGIQNYLFKPFEDEKLFEEIRKSLKAPWWKQRFDPWEKVQTRCEEPMPDSLGTLHKELLRDLKKILDSLQNGGTIQSVHSPLVDLHKKARTYGFPPLAEEVQRFLGIEHPSPVQMQAFCEESAIALRLLKESAFPGSLTGSLAAAEKTEPEVTPASKSKLPERTPSGQKEEIFELLDTLSGYPVVESVAASFQMAAANPEIEVETLAEIILADPCLSVEVYYHVNHVSELARKTEEGVREQKHAIQLLGLMRIRSMASGLLVIPDEALECGGFNWQQYRTFQVGCGILAEHLVGLLSLQANPSTAYFAGLVHELGKILLAYLFPRAYQQTISLAQESGISLAEAEKHRFGCSSQSVGAYFAERSKFPPDYIDIIRYYPKPESAPKYSAILAAVISLADHLCELHHVGFSGSRQALHRSLPLSQHPAWQVLQEHVGPMFSLHRFERDVADLTRRIQRQLHGG